MSEQWTWMPVESEPIPVRIVCRDGLILNLAEGGVIDVYDDHSRAAVTLPSDIRLCRRVPATGMPVEVRRILEQSLASYVQDAKSHVSPDLAAQIQDDVLRVLVWLQGQQEPWEQLLAWLDAQPQPGQEGTRDCH